MATNVPLDLSLAAPGIVMLCKLCTALTSRPLIGNCLGWCVVRELGHAIVVQLHQAISLTTL